MRVAKSFLVGMSSHGVSFFLVMVTYGENDLMYYLLNQKWFMYEWRLRGVICWVNESSWFDRYRLVCVALNFLKDRNWNVCNDLGMDVE